MDLVPPKKSNLTRANSSSSPMFLRRMNGWRTSPISKPGELIKKMCGSLSGLRVCMITQEWLGLANVSTTRLYDRREVIGESAAAEQNRVSRRDDQ
jgi:hypothetical protein